MGEQTAVAGSLAIASRHNTDNLANGIWASFSKEYFPASESEATGLRGRFCRFTIRAFKVTRARQIAP